MGESRKIASGRGYGKDTGRGLRVSLDEAGRYAGLVMAILAPISVPGIGGKEGNRISGVNEIRRRGG